MQPDTHKTPTDPSQSGSTIVSLVVVGLVEPDDRPVA
jgi:hypothetical protein